MNSYLKAFIRLGLLVILALSVWTGHRASAAANWYVKLGGSDANDCHSPATACASINGALSKAAAGDTILVTAETYYGYGPDFLFIEKDTILSGGWDKEFITQAGHTVADGQGKRIVLETTQSSTVTVEHFNLQNGYSDISTAAGISNYGNLTLVDSIVQDNEGTDDAGGIFNYGTLTVIRSTIRNNSGIGLRNWDQAQGLTIIDSTISNNTLGVGIFIYGQSASIMNSTISGNQNPGTSSFGGGIYYGGSGDDTLTLKNVTITGNITLNSGGGIYFNNLNGGQILISDTILAGNISSYGMDCYGPINSQGYNIVGNNTGCTFNSSSGDLINVDPLIASLQYNGRPTATHRLLSGSPAIDGGNPAGCTGQNGEPLITDQRGFVRPLDGNGDGNAVCDIGAYEFDPSIIIRGFFLPVIAK